MAEVDRQCEEGLASSSSIYISSESGAINESVLPQEQHDVVVLHWFWCLMVACCQFLGI